MRRGNIIYLNGVSSAGKTTLAKLLVHELPDYFHFSIDDFDLLIERMEDRANGRFIPAETEHLFCRSVAMFSDRGVNLIVDDVLYQRSVERDCLQVLVGYPVLFVGVKCPLDELERRERERGDRKPGQARAQLEYVHKFDVYDVEVDSERDKLDVSVRRIVDALRRGDFPKGWDETAKLLL